jgi:hypothetical protein
MLNLRKVNSKKQSAVTVIRGKGGGQEGNRVTGSRGTKFQVGKKSDLICITQEGDCSKK